MAVIKYMTFHRFENGKIHAKPTVYNTVSYNSLLGRITTCFVSYNALNINPFYNFFQKYVEVSPDLLQWY